LEDQHPADTHLSCYQRTYYTVSRDGSIATSVALLTKRAR